MGLYEVFYFSSQTLGNTYVVPDTVSKGQKPLILLDKRGVKIAPISPLFHSPHLSISPHNTPHKKMAVNCFSAKYKKSP